MCVCNWILWQSVPDYIWRWGVGGFNGLMWACGWLSVQTGHREPRCCPFSCWCVCLVLPKFCKSGSINKSLHKYNIWNWVLIHLKLRFLYSEHAFQTSMARSAVFTELWEVKIMIGIHFRWIVRRLVTAVGACQTVSYCAMHKCSWQLQLKQNGCEKHIKRITTGLEKWQPRFVFVLRISIYNDSKNFGWALRVA